MGGEPKRVSGGWEFDIPAAGKPADGKLVVYAAVPQAFLKGQSETLLAGDMSPVTTVPLSKDTSAMVRGRILSSSGEPVSGAHVGLVGYPSETVETSGDGNFILSAHAADNQQVQLYADKVGYEPATKWCPAGDFPNTIVMNRHQGKQ